MIQIYITKLRIYIYAMKIPMKSASRDFLGDSHHSHFPKNIDWLVVEGCSTLTNTRSSPSAST